MTESWQLVTGDRVLSRSPGNLNAIIITPSSASKRGDITLYDGESTDDPLIITLRTDSGTSNIFQFVPSLKTHRGLYIDVGGDVLHVLVHFSWGKE